jgi:hypothetical protein
VGILEQGRILAFGPIGAIGAKLDAAKQEALPPGGQYRARSTGGRRAARLRVIGDRERIVAAVATVAQVEDVIVSDLGSVSLSYDGDERTLGQVVRALVRADVLVCGVEPEQNELERIFLELTAGVQVRTSALGHGPAQKERS